MNKAVITSLSRSKELTREIATILNISEAKNIVTKFSDGEILVQFTDSIRGKHVYLVQATSAPVTESLMELLIAVDALKRASADEVTVIMPYYGYARQDRKAKARQPITARLVADMLNVAGVDRVVTFDLHAAQIQGFFKCPVDDMSAIPLFSYYFRNLNLNKDIVVVSPDHGGVTRARRFGDLLSAPIAIMDKRRPKPNVAEVTSVIGDVKGKIAIMVDDIVDTAGTLTAGAKKLIDEGALQVFAACTHAVLSGSAIENIESSVIEELIVSNTIELNNNKKISKIKVLSVGPMLAKIIEQIEKGLPLSNVYNLYQKF